jgi:hypothetical protein
VNYLNLTGVTNLLTAYCATRLKDNCHALQRDGYFFCIEGFYKSLSEREGE